MLLALSLFGTSNIHLARHRFMSLSSGTGTVICGLAPSMKVLIAARAVAGMGGGGCVKFVVTNLL